MSKTSKKTTHLSELGDFVFSTNSNFELNSDDNTIETLEPNQQKLEAYLDRKNRGGKTATLIKGFQGAEEDLKTLAKNLKNLCGVGGTAKEGEIIIQGDFRVKIMDYLIQKGYKVKRIGG